ncbi:DUF2189 domain-containing protein [Methylobacterium durans]|uniref:DUF2189 domain-containing protein n=1 Tax=Methylobacterium durans TaxID=2202825 RepID=A0A2U8WCB4_9HYPH|nr:DUF2189 domain-containing protein [Methylobacterium durans]AWN43248.1 hypothetical protein DK389_25525 [Methylobacterium durans]
MTTLHAVFHQPPSVPHPRVRALGIHDLRVALARGVEDFLAMPTHVVFAIAIYPIAGIVIATLTFEESLIPLLFPLASGFALVGPFAAIGLYEMSRRREQGLVSTWSNAYEPLRARSAGSIFAVGFLLMTIFLAWLVAAMGLYWALYDNASHASVPAFLEEVVTTGRGWTLILLGNLVGFAFSLVALAVSVVSIPLLVDRDIDALAAIETSMAVVRENPGPMLLWGFIVAGLLLVGMLPLFVGLAVVLPVLGHATWHLYRRAVAPP